MGWTSGYHSRKELVDYVTAHQENQVSTFDCIAKKFVGNHLWCVFERTAKPAPTDKERYIILFDIQRWGEGNWAYKDIQESMGPFQHSCPLSFLDMVPEPPRPAGYHDWRQGVRDYHARRNQKTYRWADRKAHQWRGVQSNFSPSVARRRRKRF